MDAPQAIFRVRDERQPRGAVGSGLAWPIVFRKHTAIKGRQIRCSLPGSMANQKLVFEQERLRGDGAYATGAEQLCAGDHQVNGEDEDFAHRANGTIPAGAFKTARRRRIASHYEFAPHTVKTCAPCSSPYAMRALLQGRRRK